MREREKTMEEGEEPKALWGSKVNWLSPPGRTNIIEQMKYSN